jgi:hypothetical protein
MWDRRFTGRIKNLKFKTDYELGMVFHTCNPSTREAEQED